MERKIRLTSRTNKASDRLMDQHFDYTLVFGQGPVQEVASVPKTGDEGLNVFSRLIALSAAQLLNRGITKRVILTGGETGARAGRADASKEAELMADSIRRQLTSVAEDKRNYLTNGHYVPLFNHGSRREKKAIDQDIIAAWKDKILLEDKAKDTLENIVYILNTYIPFDSQAKVALLGVSFHTDRLRALNDIFGLQANVYAAEEVLRETLSDKRAGDLFVKQVFTRLTNLSEYRAVAILKSRQERLLIQYLQQGDWIRLLPVLQSDKRGRSMILYDHYVLDRLKQAGISSHAIETIPYTELMKKIKSLDRSGQFEGRKQKGYKEVKQAVFDTLTAMSKKEGIDYFGRYAKGKVYSN